MYSGLYIRAHGFAGPTIRARATVQTFLPDAGFVRSARALDDKRLGKQRVETFQILRALIWPTYGWKRHPAVTMWRGFTPALVAYGVATCREWAARGHADALEPQFLDYGTARTFAELSREGRLPPWLGDDAVHESHRRALANKAPELYPKEWSGEPGYVWPTPPYPVWPLPFRVGRDPLTSETPTKTVGHLLDVGAPGAAMLEPGYPAWDALRELKKGESVDIEFDEPSTLTIAASRVRAGLTACILDRDEPTDDPLPDATAEQGGTVSTSVARTPGELDREAMAVEKTDPGRIRWFRRGQAIDPSDFSLVVTTGAEIPPELSELPTLTITSSERG
ncbi:MSMEG_6728 family protein [Rhodococcoides kyotonense]|uniref:MSMEG_6728 family protein n=1 Tax=Rhodococcoides kyotonense TaxID=398843 RepID=UPI000B18BE02|nr:MSMEG_6728 family protein [Rhodococcus kyotonensis]